jgi:hypothetical protein
MLSLETIGDGLAGPGPYFRIHGKGAVWPDLGPAYGAAVATTRTR